MRPRPLLWLLLSVLCFAAAFCFWRLGDHWATKRNTPALSLHSTGSTLHAPRSTPTSPFKLQTQSGTLNSPPIAEARTNHASHVTNRFALRLSNTSKPLAQLLRSDQAVLLENVLLDTTRPAVLPIPDHLRAQGDPGSYLVQSRGPIDNAFRSRLQAAGATIVSYIPNNAFLVRGSVAAAQQLQAAPQTQAVLPYEPYYKLKSSLLKLAVAQTPLPTNAALNVLLFADAAQLTRAALQDLGAEVLSDAESSPFGPVLTVRPTADSLSALAGLPGVQEVEWALPRATANDLSRVRIGVSTDTLVATNYLGLTGTNVLVNVNDTGVDATHPDLNPRVFGATANDLVDYPGHGTHVAGIIASSGSKSTTPVNVGAVASGSISNASFRGKAPAASLFSLPVGLPTGQYAQGTVYWPSDAYLQQTAARTNAFISNNSWNYVGPNEYPSYDLHAASYDAAVRDALPTGPGSRPMLYVFSAGNGGGSPDSILSPATAKNVITVGAIEQPRYITNIVTKVENGSTNTSTPWYDMTDSSDQVAALSSCGNVGIGTEGPAGRFKPDVVAPGTFVVSTRSSQWDTNAYYNPTSHLYTIIQNLEVATNELWGNGITIPDNAVQWNIFVVPNTNSPRPFPPMPIYVSWPDPPTNGSPVLGTNQVSLPPDQALNPVGADWFYAIGNSTTQSVSFDVIHDIVVTNQNGNYLQVLQALNDSLGPYYRYESGTSMAAAEVSGMLALMQEFFEQRLGCTNSPALMKALVINGARTVSGLYDFNTRPDVNHQGWGLINLPTTLPGALTNISATNNSIFVIDQSPTSALATGQSRTYLLSLSPAAQQQDLRVTLVWTDPPGNPLASVKLVNDLDLIITNLVTTNVYFGNDIGSGPPYNLAWLTNTVPNLDVVNNVENIFLSPQFAANSRLSTNYSITVVGRRVNVNAVTAQTNNVSQDYALVISCGNPLVTNAFTLSTNALIVSVTQPLATVVTNQFGGTTNMQGGILLNQRVGANTQLQGTNTLSLTNSEANALLTVGMTNQWHFYLLTNNTSFTNAAFLIFLPTELAVPRMGVYVDSVDNATRPEADIDLYVAPPNIPNNYALTNLDTNVLAIADKALSRGGTETIIYSNAIPGIYYIGVKSEDQMAAEYAFMGVISQEPFGVEDLNGNFHLRGIPLYQAIPDGSGGRPGVAQVMAIAPLSIKLHRAIVTNIVNHEYMGDLLGNLSHKRISAVLNNHTCVLDPVTTGCETWTSYIYDDSNERNVRPNPALINSVVQHTDGPGSLGNFSFLEGQGQWLLTMEDNATNHLGTNVDLEIFLERQQNLTGNGITAVIEPGACRADPVDVPPNAISLTVEISFDTASPPTQPIAVSLDVCPANGGACKSLVITNALGGSVTIDQFDVPPLQFGTNAYIVTTCNLGTTEITVHIRAFFSFSLNTVLSVLTTNTIAPVPILDDAVTHVYLTNNVHQLLSSLDVGLLVQDPRVSDLAITLISPDGTRIVLFENRGAGTTNGLGTFSLGTNYDLEPFLTNNFDLVPVGLYATGAVFQGWSVLSNFVDVLDDYTCLCLSNHILALLDGVVSNSLPTTNLLSPSNSYPYTLTFRANHLPWLEGMVTWWPLDFDGSDIFGGFNGLVLGDVLFSQGQSVPFFDNFPGPALNPAWQAYLPTTGTGGGQTVIENYVGAPNYSFALLGTNSIIRLSNTLNPQERRGWRSSTAYYGQSFRYDVRFNTLTQGAGVSIGGFIEIWILDALNPNRYDVISPFGGDLGNSQTLLAGSSIDTSNYTLPFNYANNTWYHLVVAGGTGQNVRASVFDDNGHELVGQTLAHDALAFNQGFRIGLSQFMGTPAAPAPVDAAVDYAKLTTVLTGKVNQAFFGDGIATRMVVPRCPELNLGLGRGFSIEGWINPDNVTLRPLVAGATVMTSGFENVPAEFDIPAGTFVAGWHVDAGNIDVLSSLAPSFFANPDSGTNCIDINGAVPGTISTNLSLVVGRTYQLSFAYGRNPHSVQTGIVPQAAVNLAGVTLATVAPNTSNSWSNVQWQHTSVVFTASSALSTLQLQGLSSGADGVLFDSFQISELVPPDIPAPLVEWDDPTNASPLGVQLWINGLAGTSSPGALWANIWDTNLQPHVIATVTNALTNGGWQHVALTYDTNSGIAALYVNGLTNTQPLVATNLGRFVPRTSGDLYLGFHPPGLPAGACYAGGLDEFSVYQRALSPCEVNAIFNAGSRGKYGTNVLVCPVTTEVTLGGQVYTFTNGVTWTNAGPFWETNTINFSLPSTNPTPIIVRGLNPYATNDLNAANNLNVVVDDFVLSELVPHTIDGLLHFNEDPNLATIPIKFAPTPYAASNYPPILVFTNDFRYATARVYQAGSTIQGVTNDPASGPWNWTVVNGPVTVVSNAFLDALTTNCLAMATGGVQCLLPTIPGHRYQLGYTLRGPCAVGWWNGSVEPLSQRAQDLISGNHGAFLNGATNTTAAYRGDIRWTFVGTNGFFFSGQTEPVIDDPDIWLEDIDDPSSKIELADPPQLQFTNAFTIEGWIKPTVPGNFTYLGTEQIFFRGYPEPFNHLGLGDPYWLALEPTNDYASFNLHFHIADAHTNTLGADVITTNNPILPGGGSNGGWWHIAAVFDKPVTNYSVTNGTNVITFSTNALRLYVNGVLIASNYTTLSPYQDLDPALSPGVTIGDRCRYDWTQPFSGYMDEITVYARALTDPEIAAIAAAGTGGKAEPSIPTALSLAGVSVAVDGVPLGTAYGDNSVWSTHSVEFTALDTNAVLTLQSLLPGTLLEGITLTDVATELYYLPEVSLSGLYGQDAFGVWTLEIQDDRAGPSAATNNTAQLVEWQLQFRLAPSNPPPVIYLLHGIPYTNTIVASGVQYFVVQVPQWATMATNILQFANQVRTANPEPVTVFFSQTNSPAPTNLALIGPLVSQGTNLLSTNSIPLLLPGQSYYLALTNPNPVAVTFSLGVWFDITTLANCQVTTNFVAQAGIPRYFQFDVPTNAVPPNFPPQSVFFWISNAPCDLKVVLSEHLPLPDLDHFDYISQQPCTNDQIIMLVTNTTPFPIQTNRWYVGVFNTGTTNVPFAVEACYATNYPLIIPLTNGIPFVVASTNAPFAAPPGPPQWFFFDLLISDAVPGVLFELYNLSGDADLVLQQDVPPTMPPYFDSSFATGTNSEQIVVRTNPAVPATSIAPDLRGHWYLGVYNNEPVNVAYTIRAVLPNSDGLLLSAQPLHPGLVKVSPPPGWLVSWNSVIGETYVVRFTNTISSPVCSWPIIGSVTATTPLTTFELTPPPSNTQRGFFWVSPPLTCQPVLKISLASADTVRISWSTAYPGYTLQSKLGLFGAWSSVAFPPATGVFVIGGEFVVYDAIGTVATYYRLIK